MPELAAAVARRAQAQAAELTPEELVEAARRGLDADEDGHDHSWPLGKVDGVPLVNGRKPTLNQWNPSIFCQTHLKRTLWLGLAGAMGTWLWLSKPSWDPILVGR